MFQLLDLFPKSWYADNAEWLPCILEACQKIYDQIDVSIKGAKDGLNVNSAQGYFLDLQGQDYNIYRDTDEDDESLRNRIQAEMLSQKNTVFAIIAAAKNAGGRNNSVYQPWRNLFTVSQSELSGPDKITDYEYWNYHVIDLFTDSNNPNIQKLISRVIAAAKTLYITNLIDAKAKRTSVVLQRTDMINEFDFLFDQGPRTNIGSIDIQTDLWARRVRYLWWSPALPINNKYQFENGVEVPFLMFGSKVINEIQGVDY